MNNQPPLSMKIPRPAFDRAQSVTALVLLAAILAFALLALLAPPAQAARGPCLTKAALASPARALARPAAAEQLAASWRVANHVGSL